MDFRSPYPPGRMPVLARNVVATSQPLAAQAGLRMLLAGGNAVDAALAAAIALTVVEPTNNGLGSDAFAVVWDGERLHGLNASGRSPKGLRAERFAGLDRMPSLGWDAVTVPGAVSAWVALSERFGALPFERLFEPAIHYARHGFLVSPGIARTWRQAAPALASYPGFADAFLPDGCSPGPGEVFKNADQAHSLEAIAATRGEAFYRGELADAIVAAADEGGSPLNHEDLAEHRPEWVSTLSTPYRDLELHELPPNGQGVAALAAVGMLRAFDLASFPVDSADALHLQIEATKLAMADANRNVAEVASMDVDPVELLDPDYLAQRARSIDPARAHDASPGLPRGGDTVYVTAADASGTMVSFIQSNFVRFGSGVVVPGTGIALQNRASGFSLEPGHPNVVAGGKRPFHTIIPGFVTQDGQPRLSFGVMGGSMQAQGHVQMLVRLVDYRQNPQAACDAPRWRLLGGRRVALEAGVAASVADELRSRGHEVVPGDGVFFGGAQLAWRTDDGYIAASDHRRDGQAVGY